MILVDFAPILPEFFSLGLVGVGLVSWLGDDGSDEVEQEGDVGDEFDMDEDDEFGMDGFDDDFGGMDGMGGAEEGGASSTELDNRIEDLESEVANVSSTANTVRSENEQISEKVDDVEENVRKLLEIYEMVTRGVNPFVDDVNPDAGMGGGGGDFGLFADEDGGQTETEEDLGSDIADAEAEDFFEDDAFDDEFEEEEEFDPEDEDFGEEFDGAEMADDDFGDFAEDESMNGDELLDGETEETETTGDPTDGSDVAPRSRNSKPSTNPARRSGPKRTRQTSLTPGRSGRMRQSPGTNRPSPIRHLKRRRTSRPTSFIRTTWRPWRGLQARLRRMSKPRNRMPRQPGRTHPLSTTRDRVPMRILNQVPVR